jgi:hypothetical protein
MLKKYLKYPLIIIVLFLSPALTLAHQPRIVENYLTPISNPEISQAFYGELKGTQAEFRIVSAQDFKLYLGLLVLNFPNIKKDISAQIFRVRDGREESVAILDGIHFVWTPFFEDFAKDNYFWGPEYATTDSVKGKELKGRLVPAGEYRIRVFNPENSGKYVLVTGFLEVFPWLEIVKASIILPRLKAQFFGYSLPELFSSPYVWGYLLVIYVLAFLFGLLYSVIVKRLAKNATLKAHKNIGNGGRLICVAIGAALLSSAITTTWNPIVILLSGFAFFKAVA